MSARTSFATPRVARTEADAITMLTADHDVICQLFNGYDRATTAAERVALVLAICTRLRVHMQIEDEIFCPDIHAASRRSWLPPVAHIDRARTSHLVRQLEAMKAPGVIDEAKVAALSDLVVRHIEQAHHVMFPRARASSADLVDLGARMAARKADLLAGGAASAAHSPPAPSVHDPEPQPPGAPPVDPDEGPLPVQLPNDPERGPVGDPPH